LVDFFKDDTTPDRPPDQSESAKTFRQLAELVQVLLTTDAPSRIEAQKRRIEAVKLLVLPYGITLRSNLYRLHPIPRDFSQNLLAYRFVDPAFLESAQFRLKQIRLRRLFEAHPHEITNHEVRLLWESLNIVAHKPFDPGILKLFLLQLTELIASLEMLDMSSRTAVELKEISRATRSEDVPTEPDPARHTPNALYCSPGEPCEAETIILGLLERWNPARHRLATLYDLLSFVNKRAFLRVASIWDSAPPARQSLALEIFHAAQHAHQGGQTPQARQLFASGERVLRQAPHGALRERYRNIPTQPARKSPGITGGEPPARPAP